MKKNAFTLIQFLVIISICSLITALLFPALAAIKRSTLASEAENKRIETLEKKIALHKNKKTGLIITNSATVVSSNILVIHK